MIKITTDSKLYFAVSCTLALCLAVILIYRYIPEKHGTDDTTQLSGVLFPETAAPSYTVTETSAPTAASPVQSSLSSPAVTEHSQALININSAGVNELTSLKGIGEKKALAIIEYREANDGFTSVDELTEVNGIGEKTLEAIRNSICV